MALKLIANYSKRLGLPGYSSHQFSVCVETEIKNIDDVGDESSRLYQTLQRSVDHEIQIIGFVPTERYAKSVTNSNAPSKGDGSTLLGLWQCSDKQQGLILSLIDDNCLDNTEVEALSFQHFGKGPRDLDRKQASQFIDQMFRFVASLSGNGAGSRNGSRAVPQKGGRR